LTNTRYPAIAPGQTPYHDNNGGQKLGLVFSVTTSTTIDGAYFYAPVAHSDYHFELSANGVIIAEVVSAVVVGDNFVPFTAPVQLSPAVEYTIALAVYPEAGHQFDTALSDYTAVAFGGGTVGPFVFGGQPGRYADQNVTATTIPTTPSSNWYGIAPYVNENVVAPTPLTVSASIAPTSVETGKAASLTATPHNGSGAVSYAWSQLSGPTTTIATPTAATASVTPSQAGSYSFRVTATDSTGSATADVQLAVTAPIVSDPDPDPTPDPTPTPTPQPGQVLWVRGADGKWYPIGSASSTPAPSPAAHPGVFYPEDFGAKGDGVTDDTAAWNDCIAAAVAAAPQFNYAVVVEGQAKEYLIAGAPVKGRQYGNAQISIPHVPASTSRKITLTIRGASIASTFLHWDQSARQSIGTVLHSTFTGGSYDGTWGVPSILGGPTNLTGAPQDQFATFSNMHVVIDGISTLQPAGASLIGFDLRRIGQAHVPSAASFSDRTRKSNPPIESLTNNDQSVGLVMPFKGNNARSEIGSYTAEGLHTALIASEHLVADYLGVIYCRRGLQIAGLTNGDYSDGQRRIGDHSIYIGRYLAEAVDYWVYNDSTATQLVIDSMGGEGTTNFVAHVYDQISGENGRGGLTGRINLLDIFQRFAVVEGNTSLRIISDGVLPGRVYTTPDVPGSTVALRNPFWRDATVVVTGGNVSKIEVEGVDLGVTSGPVPLPTGQRITITYSSAPSWRWLLS
jgi:hypothetical protein